MSKEKQPNYTEEMTTELVEAYTSAESDEERVDVINTFSADFGKSPASIRQKLVRENVYVKPEKAEAGKKGGEKKADLVMQIAHACGTSAEVFDSLEKATFPVLRILRERLVPMAKEGESERTA